MQMSVQERTALQKIGGVRIDKASTNLEDKSLK